VETGLTIREVEESDSPAVHAIYAHHVLYGTASFDYEPPPVQVIAEKIHWIIGQGWPFVIAEVHGTVAGYAYVTQFRDRAAYRFAAENSIYVHPDFMGCGIGKALLDELVERSTAFGFHTIIAVIGGAEPGSIALHAGARFREVGRLSRVGWKHDRWLDSVYMQRELAQPR
jgi:L-amino acid N-acyltransferase YncA